jgi:hypothetical protein
MECLIVGSGILGRRALGTDSLQRTHAMWNHFTESGQWERHPTSAPFSKFHFGNIASQQTL